MLILGQPDDEDEEKTGIINLIFRENGFLRDEEFVDTCRADHQIWWMFEPYKIRERVTALLEMEGLDGIPLTDAEFI